MSVDCHRNQIGLKKCHFNEILFSTFLIVLGSAISGTFGKSSEPIIIILGPPGAGLPSSASASTSGGPLGQIEATLSDRDSSGSTRSTFNLFRSTSDKKDEKKGPHIIFIGGSATSPMNHNNGGGPMMGSMQGGPHALPPPPPPPPHGQGIGGNGGPGMNNFMTNPNINNNGFGSGQSVSSSILSPGPMRRGSNGPGISVTGNNYPPYPMSSNVGGSINSGSMLPNYPYIPYVMGGGGGGGGYTAPTSYPPAGYDYTDYVWNGWKR